MPVGPIESGTGTTVGMLARLRAEAEATSQRLATGRRIVRAADDPAGLIAATHLNARAHAVDAQINALERANLRSGARGAALGEAAGLLAELKATAVAAANRDASGAGESAAVQLQAGALLAGLDYLAASATFAGESLLAGLSAASLGLADLDLLSDPAAAQAAIDQALAEVTGAQAAGGAAAQANEAEARALAAELEATLAAESALADADLAAESAQAARTMLLEQVAIRVELLRRDAEDNVLELLAPVVAAAHG